jgi:NADH:ubiquinone oxidoreductase subunit 4 (subunit M)
LAILFSCIFYSGLPGTIKFITEFYILTGLVETAPYMTIILIFMVNFIGLIGFSKCWFNVVFGLSPNLQIKKAPDLTYKESLIIVYCFYTFISLSFVISYIL